MVTIQTFVTYLLPGAFVAEETSRPVESRSVEEAVREAPEHAYAFTFWERLETEHAGEKLIGRPRDRSKRYYLGGEVMTVEDVRGLDGDFRTLIANMESNRWYQVIRCRTGNFQPFKDGDRLIDV